MSLVGTRPPTVDEWEQYELHHRCKNGSGFKNPRVDRLLLLKKE